MRTLNLKMTPLKAILPPALLLLAGCASVQTPAWQARPEAGPDRGAQAAQTRPLSEKEKKDSAALEAWLKTMKANPQEALKAYKNVSASMPERWQVNYDAAVAYLRLNKPEPAVAELNAALGKKDAAPGVVYGALGAAYASMGKKDDSAAAFKKAFEHGAGAGVLVNAGAASMETGRLDEALIYYREAEALEPKNPALHYNLGLLMYRKGFYRRALEEFGRASGNGLDGLKVSLCKAQTLLRLGRHGEALRLFEEIASRDTNYFYLHKQIGIIYELYAGDMKKAFEHYNLYLSVVKGDKDVESWIEIVQARLAREGQ